MAWPEELGYPQRSSYDLETGDATVRTDMESGPARVRRRFTAAPDSVVLRFVFTAAQMATFRAFWETDFLSGAAWVDVPVRTGRVAGVEIKPCRPTGGKFKASLIGRDLWSVEIAVEVRNA